MAGRLIGKGSANSSTVASPSASRRTMERRVGSDKAAKTTSNRSGAVTGIVAVPPADTSQLGYLTEYLTTVKDARIHGSHLRRGPTLEHQVRAVETMGLEPTTFCVQSRSAPQAGLMIRCSG